METKLGPILVVDDDEDDHDLLRSVCRELKICSSLRFFFKGQELIDYLTSNEQRPFLILYDINMPHINGLDLRELIWTDPDLRSKSIPFIFFSTAASPEQVERAFNLTVQGFFLKGNTFEETVRKLKLVIDYWIESRHPNQ
jgi:CheY-like chemotaxis protein